MDPSRLKPETPRRQLLKRIHRRSSVLTSMDHPSSLLAPSSSTLALKPTSRRPSLIPESTSPHMVNATLEEHDEAEQETEHAHNDHEDTQLSGNFAAEGSGQDEFEDGGDENGEEAAWAQVDELMDTVQLKNQRILELEKNLSSIQRDLALEKDRSKPAKGSNSNNASDKGLTRAAAVKLEREFLSQEMILKGLQRDNEDKTLEVETLRRKVKIMSDFLARQYGADDWENVVSASTGTVLPTSTADKGASSSPEKEPPSAVARVLSSMNIASPRPANKGKFSPGLVSDSSLNPFFSPTKALNNDDTIIPTIARMQSPASSPSKLFIPSFAPRRTSMDNADTTVEQDEQEAQPSPLPSETAALTLPVGVDPHVLLASIESVRLLIQGFERKNAMRRAELEKTIDSAIQAERRAERLQADTSQATTAVAAS